MKNDSAALSRLTFPLMETHRQAEDILEIFPVSVEDCYGPSSQGEDAMQKKKTHFEQVPLEVAEHALRQQTSKPRGLTKGTVLSLNSVPQRLGTRRFVRRRLHR
jgi:hypothetical protein